MTRETTRGHIMFRPLIAVFATSAALLGATAAHAGGAQWSVGINLPVAAVALSNGGYYEQSPVPAYYPGPVVYAPRPYCAPRRVYAPPVVYAVPEPAYRVRYAGWRDGDDHRWEHERQTRTAR